MQGFKPIYNKNSKILILGSFPSVKSRENNFYYGNKLNKFWKTLETIYNVRLVFVEDKINFLLENNIALWDICQSCDIDGSLDSNIKNVEFADIKSILPPNTKIKKILCNGKKSYTLTKKYLKQNNIDIDLLCLPSSSPANTSFSIIPWQNELTKL